MLSITPCSLSNPSLFTFDFFLVYSPFALCFGMKGLLPFSCNKCRVKVLDIARGAGVISFDNCWSPRSSAWTDWTDQSLVFSRASGWPVGQSTGFGPCSGWIVSVKSFGFSDSLTFPPEPRVLSLTFVVSSKLLDYPVDCHEIWCRLSYFPLSVVAFLAVSDSAHFPAKMPDKTKIII